MKRKSSNEETLISVIVPVYNTEDYLEECADSILKQTYSRLEVILVDDGSRDRSGELCDSYARKDNRIKVIHKENGGLMSAWTAGVKIAGGEYLAFVDSDDWIEPDMLEKLEAQTSREGKEIICSNYRIEKKQESIPAIQSMNPGVYSREEIEKQLFPHLLGEEVRRIHSSRCMKLISRSLILDNLKFCNPSLTMGEDMNIILPSILDAKRIVVMEEGLFYHYRLVDSSMVHQYNDRLYEKIYQLYITLQKILEAKGAGSQLLQDLKKEYIFLLFLAIKNELRGPKEGCRERIIRMVEEAKEEEELKSVRVKVRGRANRLLYGIWKKPDGLRIALGRLAIGIFDGKAKREKQ